MTDNKKLLDEFFEKKDDCKSFITTCKKEAYEQAEYIEKEKKCGKSFVLDGVLAGIKDNIFTENIKTTCASKMLKDFTAPYDAEAVKRLKENGAVIVGKVNMDEFAMGGSGETSYFGAAKNPWNKKKIAGGSSSGSASAVAGGLVDITLGSDTGGSVRQPASMCGVTGFKPSYGRVSRYGLVPYASSYDQIGIIAKTADEIKKVYKCICGYDPKDSTSSKESEKEKAFKPETLKIGIEKNILEYADSEIRQAILKAIDFFEAFGAKCEYFEFPYIDILIPVYFVIAFSEASSNLSRFDGIRYGFCDKEIKNADELFTKNRTLGFGKEVKKRIVMGNLFLSFGENETYYQKAVKLKRVILNEYKKAFQKYDIIISPTYLDKTPDLGKGKSNKNFIDKFKNELCTVSANISGFPAISVPCGFMSDGMPIGMHIMSDKFTDEFLLDTASYFQNKTNFHISKEVKPSGI